MRRLFLILILASLAISGLVGIVIFILGNFEDDDFGGIQFKLLFTTFTLAGFSVAGFTSSLLYDRERSLLLCYAGIAVSLAGFVVFMVGIWGEIWNENYWKSVGSIGIVVFSIAHASILALGDYSRRVLRFTYYGAVAAIISLATVLISVIVWELDQDGFYRLLGVLAILDVLGTISIPILRKITYDTPAK